MKQEGAPPEYPFAAVVGQEKLKQALLWCAVDPSLGGLLICGARGSAKSTLARGLAELLGAECFVTLPLGASEEKITGTLDLEAALAGRVKFSPGLLQRAHGGVLYVDEINLLPDRLVDVLLEAAASGVNFVERDGVSHRHGARFLLIGTMNPEEGELRPQLLDRFGLCHSGEEQLEEAQRMEAVQRRLAFDQDPQAFRQAYAVAQEELAQRIVAARARLEATEVNEALRRHIAGLCRRDEVEGLRADLALYRSVRAAAALAGKSRVEVEQVEQAAEFALGHRRRAPAQHRVGRGDQELPESSHPRASRHGSQQQSAAGGSGSADNSAAGGPQQESDVPHQAGVETQGEGETRPEGGGDWGSLPPTAVSLGPERVLFPEEGAKKH